MKVKLSDRTKETIVFLATSLLATVTLFLSLTGLSLTIIDQIQGQGYYLMGCYFTIAISHFISILLDRKKGNLICNLILIAIYLTLGILANLGHMDFNLIFVTSIIFPIAIIFDRVVSIIKNKSFRNILINALIILIDALFLLIIIGSAEEGNVSIFYLFLFAAMSIIGFKNIIVAVFSRIRFSLMKDILLKTYAGEILLGLVVLILASALVLSLVEPGMRDYGDALWYCFAVVTTIGFGDLKAVTPFGRILSVILGIYGIIVVALLTSIIVNFYNETAHHNRLPPKEKKEKEDKKEEGPKK